MHKYVQALSIEASGVCGKQNVKLSVTLHSSGYTKNVYTQPDNKNVTEHRRLCSPQCSRLELSACSYWSLVCDCGNVYQTKAYLFSCLEQCNRLLILHHTNAHFITRSHRSTMYVVVDVAYCY